MTAPNTMTFDLVPPRRPGVADVDPSAVDDAAYPPVAGDPYAAQDNQRANLIQRFGAVVPVAIFSVRFTAGTPVLDSFTCLPTAPTTLTFTITDVATGTTSITWPANTFPTPLVEAMTTISDYSTPVLAPATESILNGVRIRTWNPSSVLTDIAFTVAVY